MRTQRDSCAAVGVGGTFAGLVVDADGLRLIVAVVVLDAYQVGVGAVVETSPHGQHMLVGLVHGLNQLRQSNGDNNNIRVRLKPEAPRSRCCRKWA